MTDLHWERIQLVIGLRFVDEAFPSAEAELLLHRGERHEPLLARPAASSSEPSQDARSRLVRFNVFAGSDQMPLAPGRWHLAVREPGDEEPRHVIVPEAAADSALTTPEPPRDFPFGSGLYQVQPEVVPGRRVAIVISLWRSVGSRANPFRRAVRGWRDLRRRVWVSTFRAIVEVLQRLPRGKPVIVFTSDSRIDYGGNLKLIRDRMLERQLDRRFRLRGIFKPSVRGRRSLGERLRLVWLLARADVILVDDYQPAIYNVPPRRGLRIIQLWHAWGAFKTVGYSRIGKPGGLSPFATIHKNYSFATVSSQHEVPFYAEAFGLPEERVVPTGTPRMDEFLDAGRQRESRERALRDIPAAEGRRVILFAPTFRGAGARSARYPMQLLDLAALHALCVELDSIVIFKMHPFVRRPLEIPPELADRLIDASQTGTNINDLLLIADLVITDYSSLVFEYATLGRPMLFFAFDLDQYVATRDFYEPFETFVPGRIVRTFPELLAAIRREDYQVEKVGPFAERHLPAEPGSATDRIIDELILAP